MCVSEQHQLNTDYEQRNANLIADKPWITSLTSYATVASTVSTGNNGAVSSVSKAKRRLKRLLSIDRRNSNDSSVFYCDNVTQPESDSIASKLPLKRRSSKLCRSQSTDASFFVDDKLTDSVLVHLRPSQSRTVQDITLKGNSGELEPLVEIPDLPEILQVNTSHRPATSVTSDDGVASSSEHSSMEPVRCAPSPTASSCYSSCDEERKGTLSQATNAASILNQLASSSSSSSSATSQTIKSAGGSLRSVARSCSPSGSLTSTCLAPIRSANSAEQIATVHSKNFAVLLGSADSGLADSGSVESLPLSGIAVKPTHDPTESTGLIVTKLRCRPILKSLYSALLHQCSVQGIDLTDNRHNEYDDTAQVSSIIIKS